MKISGNVFLLNRANVDTDQIIPAKYLTGVSIEGLGKHLFEGIPDFDRSDIGFQNAIILVTRENFGCGSSREHAVWALEDHGFEAIIAPSFARIFRQNMFNRGLLAIELSSDKIEALFNAGNFLNEIDLDAMQLHYTVWGLGVHSMPFELSAFDKTLILQGGLVGFVAKRY